MNNKQQQPISLDVFLDKTSKLHKIIESLYERNLSMETRDNLRWYCDWRLHQYYKRYQLYLKAEKLSKE